MSIENERKYILSLTPRDITSLGDNYGGVHQYIRQAYIGDVRIRTIVDFGEQETWNYIFTWKKRRADGSRIEIETNISAKDFNELWKMADRFISKRRVKIKGYGVDWDIDFLFSDDYNPGSHIPSSCYLTIAEVEMPEGMDEPEIIPKFIKDSLLYLVPRDKDEIWTNQHLSNPEIVKKMLSDALTERK